MFKDIWFKHEQMELVCMDILHGVEQAGLHGLYDYGLLQ